MFVITDSAKQIAADKSCLKTKILDLLMSMTPLCWISADFLRIGYVDNSEENPAVVLITVEGGRLESEEAQRIVDGIRKECLA